MATVVLPGKKWSLIGVVWGVVCCKSHDTESVELHCGIWYCINIPPNEANVPNFLIVLK